MKKNKISFETIFWAGYTGGNPFKAIDAFFDFANLDYYKQTLSEAVMYCYKKEVYKQDNPSDVFILYTVFKSFLKVCYCLQKKSKKWKMATSSNSETVFGLSSLTKEEFENPFTVFEKVFDEKTLEEFELFLYQVLEFSLSPFAADPNPDLMTPYVHVIRMLDAIQIIKERGVVKIRKMDEIDNVME